MLWYCMSRHISCGWSHEQIFGKFWKDKLRIVKWIFRYLMRTSKIYLSFGGAEPFLKGYTDSDMVEDLDSRKYTSMYLFIFAWGVVS